MGLLHCRYKCQLVSLLYVIIGYEFNISSVAVPMALIKRVHNQSWVCLRRRYEHGYVQGDFHELKHEPHRVSWALCAHGSNTMSSSQWLMSLLRRVVHELHQLLRHVHGSKKKSSQSMMSLLHCRRRASSPWKWLCTRWVPLMMTMSLRHHLTLMSSVAVYMALWHPLQDEFNY